MSRFVSFLLKVWVSETLEDAAGTEEPAEGTLQHAWRGQIQHIRSGDIATFASHREMLEFIRTHLAAGSERVESDGWSSQEEETGR